ncbi:cytochrome P450 [Thozetella sp. PMI_491]|nr:cytochrome P450 [Thozetella sp. PMI_491]
MNSSGFVGSDQPRVLTPFPLATMVLLVVASYWVLAGYHRQRRNLQAGLERGCQPVKAWDAKWPFGLDMLFKALRYSREQHILQFFVDVTETSGTTFEQNLLGARGIDTIDPENIETVLSTKFSDYSLGLRAPTFHPLLGNGIFTQDGEPWKHSRQLLRPQFASNRTRNFEQIKACVQQLIQDLPSDGSTVDLQPIFFKLTFDTTMFLLFGDAVSDRDWGKVAGQESAFASAFNTGQDYLAHRGRLGPFYWLLSDRTFRAACATCHRFIEEAIQKALEVDGDEEKEDEEEGYVFIKALAQRTDDKLVLRDQSLNVLLAGRDTTGCCLSWTFRLLARHQVVLGKLRDEIRSICSLGANADPPTRDQLKAMPYLSIVVKEVLRLYPSVPVNSREAATTTVLPRGGGPGGKAPILVHPGEAVGYCAYAMHRRKDLYGEDADRFRPERWEDGSLKSIGWAYLPFNGGPRICLGQDFALLEVYYTVVRLIQVFPNITVPDSEPRVEVGKERQTLTLVVASADGCRVSMKR